MEKTVVQLYFMPHPLLEIVLRLMAHPVRGQSKYGVALKVFNPVSTGGRLNEYGCEKPVSNSPYFILEPNI